MHGKIWKRWAIAVTGVAAAIALLVWLYKDLDFQAFIEVVKSVEPGWVALVGLSVFLEQLLRGAKWRQILYDLKPVSTLRLTGAAFAGYGVSILIPLGISPLVRSWLIARLEDLRMTTVLVTSAIERFVDGAVFGIIVVLVALAGEIPGMDSTMRGGMAVAGALNSILFAGLLWLLFVARGALGRDQAAISRLLDRVAIWGGKRLALLRSSIEHGIIWPKARARQVSIPVFSVAMKIVAATYFLWAGLAVGVVLKPLDYLFLMIFAGFAIILSRFIRVPGGFIIGSGYALAMLGVEDEKALAMILTINAVTITLMVGIGLGVLWRSGVKLSTLKRIGDKRG
jgi:hypothetical protein